MNNECRPPSPSARRKTIQGLSSQIIAGFGAAAGFGLVTWWQSGIAGATIIMAIEAFIVAFAVSRISQSRKQ